MSMAATPDSMRGYYALRAAEYERVYAKPERQADLQSIQAWLPTCFAQRHVLEIACGTGWWTPQAAQLASSWLATDANEETIAIARTKPQLPEHVRFALADAYALDAIDGAFDAVFAGFWWSHVPRQLLKPWLQGLHERLPSGARIVFIDNCYVEGSNHAITRRDAHGNTYQQRRLDDGSTHEVLKNFPTRDEAIASIGPHVEHVQWRQWTHYWALEYKTS
jgi:SAM-dependent methyltransferase